MGLSVDYFGKALHPRKAHLTTVFCLPYYWIEAGRKTRDVSPQRVRLSRRDQQPIEWRCHRRVNGSCVEVSRCIPVLERFFSIEQRHGHIILSKVRTHG